MRLNCNQLAMLCDIHRFGCIKQDYNRDLINTDVSLLAREELIRPCDDGFEMTDKGLIYMQACLDLELVSTYTAVLR